MDEQAQSQDQDKQSDQRQVKHQGKPALYFRGTNYVGSYPDRETAPDVGDVPLIAFTGRSNSGKSSLISALCDHKNLAYVSGTAGKTRSLTYFHVPGETRAPDGAPPYPELYLVDMPGFGFAKLNRPERARLRALADDFLLNESRIRLIVVVLDARRSLEGEEQNILNYCRTTGRSLVFARTKWDKLNAREKKDARARWKKEGITKECLPISSTKKTGLNRLLLDIRDLLSQ